MDKKNKVIKRVKTEEQQKLAASIYDCQIDELYLHIKELSALKYDTELRREDSLIQQASHMQTAFSFISAALLMTAPIFLEYRHSSISMEFLLFSYAIVILCLLISLILASLTQRRVIKASFLSIPDIIRFVEDNQEHTLRKAEQYKQWAQVVGDVQVSLEKVNERRVKLIRWSMGFFFASIGFIIFWFVCGVLKVYL